MIGATRVAVFHDRPLVDVVRTFESATTTTDTVPAFALTAAIECWGAEGTDGEAFGGQLGGEGALGGYHKRTVTVTPGEVLTVIVGAVGGEANGGSGGGLPNAGHGGGRSEVKRAGGSRLCVAGGGGGGAAASPQGPGMVGGVSDNHGQHRTASGDGGGSPGSGGTGGTGGTADSTQGTGTSAGSAGTSTTGGAGAPHGGISAGGAGGGGGGGYGGGGGGGGGYSDGGAGGGGGGNGGAEGTPVTTIVGTRASNGKVVITYSVQE